MSDIYIVVNINTTCDDSNLYVTKDSTEIIEFSWSIVDAITLDLIKTKVNYVKPSNTPITPYCTALTSISWNQVKEANNLKDVINDLDKYLQENLIEKNKEFSFVTIDVSTLRVQLPREARDKNVVLPPYLQHPRVFDLQTEYCKWQTTHPEALSYSSSSLNNILTALGVESFGQESSDNDKSESDIEDTKENTLVHIYTKLLLQLIKKSVPVEDHSTVLTKPYDTSQDVQLFLSERSKIVYLSNLPFDTTQSELESWFTQFGARPIAFWTLKSLDNNSGNNPNNSLKSKVKGGNGFAVFGTHEEATESLSINGKALNDRAIEIQPSSTRVLDKASDLLSPFPPSKNRPRPGDWTCPSCGFSNFQRRTACFRCSFPAASAVTIQEQIYPSNGMMNNNNNNNRRQNTSNNGGSNIYSNPSPTNSSDKLINSLHSGAGNSSASNNNGYQYYDTYNSHSNNRNYNGASNNGGNGNNSSVPFRAGDWKCTNEICQYHNFAKNLVCLKCGMAKPINLHTNSKVNQHSVNFAAAAIAAATASGQSLNFNSSIYGQMQPGQSTGIQQSTSMQQATGLQQPSPPSQQTMNNRQNYKPNYLYQSNNLTRTSSNPAPVQSSNLMSQQYLMMQNANMSNANMSNANMSNTNMSNNMSNNMTNNNNLNLNNLNLSNNLNNMTNNLSTGNLTSTAVTTSNEFNPLQSTSSIGSNQSQSRLQTQPQSQQQGISPSPTDRSNFSQSANNSPGYYQAFGPYSQYQNIDPNLNFNIANQFSSLNLNNNN